MEFFNDSNLFAANSERFIIDSEYAGIQNERKGTDWQNVLQPSWTAFLENNLLEMSTDNAEIILNEPEINYDDMNTKVEIDESDLMQFAIDEIKTEWPNDSKSPTFQENDSCNKIPTWAPPIMQPESPLPTLINFTFSDILGNLPPISPVYSTPPNELLPENFSLVKLENPETVHQPVINEYSVNDEWPMDLRHSQQGVATKNSSSLLPSVERAAAAKTTTRSADKSGDVKRKDTSWRENSDKQFARKFEREEHMEEILQNYHRGGINTDDNFIYCDLCNKRCSQKCPQHGKLKTHIRNRQVPMGTEDRARKTAPHFLSVLKSKIRGANKGVWTSKNIPKRTYFGPYEGTVVPTDYLNGEYCWKVMKDGKEDFLVDGSDPNKSNWMRYVNCARTVNEQNLEAFQYRKTIYYRTIKDIKAKDELLVWYGYKYARKLGIKWKDFVESNLLDEKGAVFSCDECSFTYSNPIMMEQHKTIHHFKRTSLKESLKAGVKTKTEAQSSICMEVTTGDKPITCGVCGARFRRRGRPLQNHMREHADEKHNCCTRCGQWFPNAFSLDEHRAAAAAAQARKNHTGNAICSTGTDFKVRPKPSKTATANLPWKSRSGQPLKATNAGQTTRNKKKSRAEKDRSKYSLCDKCGTLFTKQCLLFAHLEKKHNAQLEKKNTRLAARLFKCAECGVAYRNRSTLKSHKKIHDEQKKEKEVIKGAGEEPLFACKTCSKKFKAKITHTYHMLTHEKTRYKTSANHDYVGNLPIKYKCNERNVRFRARSTLDLHGKSNDQPITSRKFMSTETLGKVAVSRSTGAGKKVSKKKHVPLCTGDAIKTKRSGVNDERKILNRDEQLTREIDELSHSDAVHKKTRRISSMLCLACGFIFKDRRTLDAHVLKHTTEKMWVCDLSSVRVVN